MTQQGITLLGLGPAGAELLTRAAWDWLSQCETVYLRTSLHPSVAGLPAQVQQHSFDALYDQYEALEDVFGAIVEEVIRLGKSGVGVTYAVPGSPSVGEETCERIRQRAAQEGIPLIVIEGLSFVEPVCAALNIDSSEGLTLVDALQLGSRHTPNFSPSNPALISQIYSRLDASEVKLTLMHTYPDDFSVRLVHAAGTPQVKVETLPLHSIDGSPHFGLLSALYVPALGSAYAFGGFEEIIARLRAPDGCPWDRKQTNLSLRPYLLEETYEVLEALDKQDMPALREELGDLLLQIVLHAEIANEEEAFTMGDVIRGISEKLIRRHPHVFGEEQVSSVDNVLSNWEKIKAEERKDNGENGKKGILDGIPLALPALTQADQIQQRAKRVGFDWPDIDPVIAKVLEELDELQAAQTPHEQSAEAGDLLFATVNLLRWLDVDPETALRACNLRFRKRFGFIEAEATRQGKSFDALSFEQMDALWEAAKIALHDEEAHSQTKQE